MSKQQEWQLPGEEVIKVRGLSLNLCEVLVADIMAGHETQEAGVAAAQSGSLREMRSRALSRRVQRRWCGRC